MNSSKAVSLLHKSINADVLIKELPEEVLRDLFVKLKKKYQSCYVYERSCYMEGQYDPTDDPDDSFEGKFGSLEEAYDFIFEKIKEEVDDYPEGLEKRYYTAGVTEKSHIISERGDKHKDYEPDLPNFSLFTVYYSVWDTGYRGYWISER